MSNGWLGNERIDSNWARKQPTPLSRLPPSRRRMNMRDILLLLAI